MPTDTFTPADLAVMIPEIWGSKVNDFYKDKQKLSAFFMDRSDEVRGGGDTLYTPNITEMSANAKANATVVTLNSPTETTQTLNISTWEEVSFQIEDKEAAQVAASYTVQKTYMKNAAYTALNGLEAAIAGLFPSFSQTAGATTVALDDAAIRSALGTLSGNNVDLSECAFVFHPNTLWSDVMGIDKFVLVDQSGQRGAVMGGVVGYLYNVPVIESTNVTTINTGADYAGFVGSNDAIHFATANLAGKGARGVRVQSNYMPEYLATLTTADICYGVVENRDNAGVQIISAVPA